MTMTRHMTAIILSLGLMLGLVSIAAAQEDPLKDSVFTDSVFAAWQPFENGVMMWFEDTDQIWVFDNNGSLRIYDDEDGGGSADSSCSSTPINGFGAIWNGYESGNLGCPLADELGFETSARRDVGGIQIQGPGATVYEASISAGSSSGNWTLINIG
jgi:hypothetical protein